MIEILVALNIKNRELYAKYRQAILPLLTQYEGHFPYDVEIKEMCENNPSKNINRIFTLRFASLKQKEAFFEDSRYLTIRQELFDNAVTSSHIISSYRL